MKYSKLAHGSVTFILLFPGRGLSIDGWCRDAQKWHKARELIFPTQAHINAAWEWGRPQRVSLWLGGHLLCVSKGGWIFRNGWLDLLCKWCLKGLEQRNERTIRRGSSAKENPSPEAGGDKEALSRRKRQGHTFQAENKHSIYKKESYVDIAAWSCMGKKHQCVWNVLDGARRADTALGMTIYSDGRRSTQFVWLSFLVW